jgi:hypothetical protein
MLFLIQKVSKMIYTSDNVLFLNQSKKFRLSYETALTPTILLPYLQCRVGGKISAATVSNSKDIECQITITKDDTLSLWYSANQTFIISSNTIRLTYFGNF